MYLLSYICYLEQEPGPAMVLRVEHMLLTCCSSISFVSNGKFSSFCLWFEDKFDPDTEEWKPDFESDPVRTRCSRCKKLRLIPQFSFKYEQTELKIMTLSLHTHKKTANHNVMQVHEASANGGKVRARMSRCP